MEETDIVIQEIDQVSQQYMPMAQACSSIYFMLDNMHQLHFLYQYSLQFFLDMFNSVLNGNPKLGSVKDYSTRLDIITKDLFQVCSQRVSRGMLHTDRLPFAILLARIYTKGVFEPAFQLFLRFREGVFSQSKVTAAHLTQEQAEGVSRLHAKVPAFKGVLGKVDSTEFSNWVRNFPLISRLNSVIFLISIFLFCRCDSQPPSPVSQRYGKSPLVWMILREPFTSCW